MEVQKTVSAGVFGKNDAKVSIEPAGSLEIDITSSVMSLFGDSIRESVVRALRNADIDKAYVTVEDKGALPWVIDARVEAAIAQLTEE